MNFPTATRLFQWQVVRYALQHRLLAILNIVSIALGVSVYVAIQIANHSADQSLQGSVDLVAGKASLEVRGEIKDDLFPKIQNVPGVIAATPTVEGYVSLPDFPGEYLHVLGVDPFTHVTFSALKIGDESSRQQFNFEKWLTDESAIALSRDFCTKYSLGINDTLQTLVNSRRVSLRVQFIVESALNDSGVRVAAMDVSHAQKLFGMLGSLSSVQVITKPGRETEVAETIRKLVPATVSVARPAQRSAQVGQMLQAFQLNLRALSLVSLLVGMFLVFNTVSASVVRRRQEIGIMRSMGVSGLQIRALFIGEALLYGVIGLAMGAVGGVILANGLVGLVGKTISSLYVLMTIDQLFISAKDIAFAVGAGLGSVFCAAWIPAGEAARLSPSSIIHSGYEIQRSRQLDFRLPIYGCVLLVLSFFSGWISLHRWPWMGFGSAFFLLVGSSLFAPLLVLLASKSFQMFPGLPLVFLLSTQNLRRSLTRSSLTVAALSSAVAMMVGVSVMIYSFRQTINTWIERTLVADLFIAPASNETIGLVAYLPPETLSWMQERPEVESVDTFREIRLPFRDQIVRMAVVRGQRRDNLRFLEGDHVRRNSLLFQNGYVLISEPFARRFHLRADDSISLPTPQGMRSFVVGGTYYDYTSDAGNILMERGNFDPLWNDARIHSLAVYLKSASESENLSDAFRKRFGQQIYFTIYSNQSLRKRIFEIFEQTFAITSALRVIAIGVAVVGVFLTLSTLVAERIRELAVLRAIGGGRRQICQMILCEGCWIGVLASIQGVASGCALALILTFVVNKAFFGWTIQFSWPMVALLTTPLWIISVSVLGGLLPAWRASRLSLAPALRSS